MSTLFDVDEVLDTVIHGDALEVLKTLPDNCVDAIVADPPSSINFMNKSWDSDKGGRTQWVAWLSEIMREARRCLRPGGHALVWSLPRTSHWTALALEDAGFEIRDQIYNLVAGDTALYNFIQSLNEEQQQAFMQVIDAQREPSGIMQIFGSGFPKSANISIMIDKLLGKEREIVGKSARHVSGKPNQRTEGLNGSSTFSESIGMGQFITKPATPESEAWNGYGSALKPSVENWWLVRKPLAAHSIAENVLEYGTGGLNIDATRIGYTSNKDIEEAIAGTERMKNSVRGEAGGGMHKGWQRPWMEDEDKLKDKIKVNTSGRFPSHLLLSHTLFCQQSGTKRVQANGPSPDVNAYKDKDNDIYNLGIRHNSPISYRDEDGMETVTNWICDESCPVRILDAQGGLRKSGYMKPGQPRNSTGGYHGNFPDTATLQGTYGDSGGPSRYFQQFPALDDVPPYIYAGKASRRDRNEGLDDLPENISHRYSEASGDHSHAPRIAKPEKNTHPTVKSQNLMRYLVRLCCPSNGIVLDMFGGSGSTGVACIHEGFHYILVEKELEYITIARSRIKHAIATVGAKPQPPPAKPPTLLRPRHKTTNIQPTLWDKEISI